jgi:hypothetical protein
MTPQELIVRLSTYRKEIFRRGLVLLLCVFIPGNIVIIGSCLLLGFYNSDLWKLITFAVVLFSFIILNFLAYIYTIWKSLPKKLDLLCGNCGCLIMDTPAQELLTSGKCAKCGGIILTLGGNSVIKEIEARTTGSNAAEAKNGQKL